LASEAVSGPPALRGLRHRGGSRAYHVRGRRRAGRAGRPRRRDAGARRGIWLPRRRSAARAVERGRHREYRKRDREMDRRTLLKALAAAPLAATLPSWAAGASNQRLLVLVFLYGGNDA